MFWPSKKPQTPSMHSASDLQESAYLLRVKRVQWARLALSGISLTAALAVLGCSADALRVYNQTHLSDQWFLPLWPQHFDLRPTKALIATGSVIAFLNLAYLVIVAIPSSRTTFLNTFSIAASFLSFTAAIVGTSFDAYIAAHPKMIGGIQSTDTLQSWTCRWSTSNSAKTAGVPTKFSTICKESHAAFDLTIVLIFLETILIGLGVWGWIGMKKMDKLRRMEKEMNMAPPKYEAEGLIAC